MRQADQNIVIRVKSLHVRYRWMRVVDVIIRSLKLTSHLILRHYAPRYFIIRIWMMSGSGEGTQTRNRRIPSCKSKSGTRSGVEQIEWTVPEIVVSFEAFQAIIKVYLDEFSAFEIRLELESWGPLGSREGDLLSWIRLQRWNDDGSRWKSREERKTCHGSHLNGSGTNEAATQLFILAATCDILTLK